MRERKKKCRPIETKKNPFIHFLTNLLRRMCTILSLAKIFFRGKEKSQFFMGTWKSGQPSETTRKKKIK
jgi:hypothetical protein